MSRFSWPFLFIILFISSAVFSQNRQVSGVYKGLNNGVAKPLLITLNPDSTFNYTSHGMHPTFDRWEAFSENGKWTMHGDTIILNPGLEKKKYVDYNFRQSKQGNSDSIWMSFYHMKRYFDLNGNIRKIDTVYIGEVHFAFNEYKKKKIRRVSSYRVTRCTFAGFIPKEIITSDPIIPVAKPKEGIKSIIVKSSYELEGLKEIKLDDSVTHFVFNAYSNYYDEGQLRQIKFLVRNKKVIYTRQKAKGKFKKDGWFGTRFKVKRQKNADLVHNSVR